MKLIKRSIAFCLLLLCICSIIPGSNEVYAANTYWESKGDEQIPLSEAYQRGMLFCLDQTYTGLDGFKNVCCYDHVANYILAAKGQTTTINFNALDFDTDILYKCVYESNTVLELECDNASGLTIAGNQITANEYGVYDITGKLRFTSLRVYIPVEFTLVCASDQDSFALKSKTQVIQKGKSFSIETTASGADLSYRCAKNGLAIAANGKITGQKEGCYLVEVRNGSHIEMCKVIVTNKTSYKNFKKLLKSVSKQKNDVDKALTAAYMINRSADYDVKYHAQQNDPDPLIMLKSKKGVCADYARCFQVLMEYIGIPSDMVISKKMNHGWNQVQLKGKWYNIDASSDSRRYLVSYKNDNNKYSSADNTLSSIYMDYYMCNTPHKCNKDYDNYYVFTKDPQRKKGVFVKNKAAITNYFKKTVLPSVKKGKSKTIILENKFVGTDGQILKDCISKAVNEYYGSSRPAYEYRIEFANNYQQIITLKIK